MAISNAICDVWKQALLNGAPNWAPNGDVIKLALYTSSATLSNATTAYSATNEQSSTGSNYTAGGVTLPTANFVTGLDAASKTAWIDWTLDPNWLSSNINARGCLIYNNTKSNMAMLTFDFGSDVVSTNGTFTVSFPAPGGAGATAVVRLSG